MSTPRPKSVRIDLDPEVTDIKGALEWGISIAEEFINTYPDRALQGRKRSCVYTNLHFGGPAYWTPGGTVVVRVGQGRSTR